MGIRLNGLYVLLMSKNTGNLLSMATIFHIPLIHTHTSNTCNGLLAPVSNNLEIRNGLLDKYVSVDEKYLFLSKELVMFIW